MEKDIYQPRLPSYVRKTATRDLPIQQLSLEDMQAPDEVHYGLTGSPTQVQRIFPPPSQKEHQLWHGEHGIGYAKRPYFNKAKDPAILDLMCAIKAAFDSENILNPHKMCQE